MERRSHAVGTKGVSPWGLYDMHGNAHEWCQDAGARPYKDAPTDGSALEAKRTGLLITIRSGRVVRGGSWKFSAVEARCAARGAYVSDFRADYLGFRLVSPLPEPGE